MVGAIVDEAEQGRGNEDQPLLNRERRDALLTARAVKSGWHVPPETRQRLLATMAELLHYTDPRVQVAAAKVLVAADAVDARRDGCRAPGPAPVQAVSVQVHLTPTSVHGASRGEALAAREAAVSIGGQIVLDGVDDLPAADAIRLHRAALEATVGATTTT